MSNISQFQFEQMQARLHRPGPVPAEPPLEKELHRQIKDHCDKQWPRWKYVESNMAKATSTYPGVPDFIIFTAPSKVLLVECKRPGQKLSLVQHSWQTELARLGHTVHVVHDYGEFLQAIEQPVGQPMSNLPP